VGGGQRLKGGFQKVRHTRQYLFNTSGKLNVKENVLLYWHFPFPILFDLHRVQWAIWNYWKSSTFGFSESKSSNL